MTCVYCEPKSRMRIFEWVARAAILTRATDGFGGRCALRPDRWPIGLMGRAFPDQSRRVLTALVLLRSNAAPEGRRSPQHPAKRSPAGSIWASSAYCRKSLTNCNNMTILLPLQPFNALTL